VAGKARRWSRIERVIDGSQSSSSWTTADTARGSLVVRAAGGVSGAVESQVLVHF
jgi:hypothetical protein